MSNPKPLRESGPASLKSLGYLMRDTNGRYRRRVAHVNDLDSIIDEAAKQGAITVHLLEDERGGIGIRFRCRTIDGLVCVGTLEPTNGRRLLDELRQRTIAVEPDPMPGWFDGYFRSRGADTVSSLRDARGTQHAVLHIGKSSIDDVDIHILDRARLVHDLLERLPDAIEKVRHALRIKLIERLNSETNLEKFDLDAFAQEYGVTLKSRQIFDFKSDRGVMLETYRRLKEAGKSFFSSDEARIKQDVMLDRAHGVRSRIGR